MVDRYDDRRMKLIRTVYGSLVLTLIMAYCYIAEAIYLTCRDYALKRTPKHSAYNNRSNLFGRFWLKKHPQQNDTEHKVDTYQSPYGWIFKRPANIKSAGKVTGISGIDSTDNAAYTSANRDTSG